MEVVSLRAFKNREVVALLEEMQQLARAGHLTGIAFVAKIGRRHMSGIEGDYRRNCEEALSAADRLHGQLLQQDTESCNGC